MRIGHYTLDLWKAGGIASYIQRLSADQRQAGHEVTLFDRAPTPPQWADAAQFLRVEDDPSLYRQATGRVDVLHVHTLVASPAQAAPPILRTLHGHEPYCPSGGRFLARTHSPCSRQYSPLGCTWGHLVDHCGSVRPRAMLAEFRRTRQEMEHTRRLTVLTVSDYLRQQMVRNGYEPQRIHVLPLPAIAAVEPPTSPPRDGEPRFVFLGRLTPQKGVDWLLKAADRVKVPIQLDIAGDGNAEPELRAQARKLVLNQRITFHGWVDSAVAMRLLQQARALVIPSLWQEPAGLVCFEAAAAGRAVIASRVGGIPEMLFEGQSGLLVEPGDVNGLAAAIERLARDWELARLLGQQGRNIVPEEFSMRKHADALMRYYEECISENSSQSISAGR